MYAYVCGAVLEECPFANNTMSFGIAIKGFPRSGQQALGERGESWGIFNNRAESSAGEPSKVCHIISLVLVGIRLIFCVCAYVCCRSGHPVTPSGLSVDWHMATC